MRIILLVSLLGCAKNKQNTNSYESSTSNVVDSTNSSAEVQDETIAEESEEQSENDENVDEKTQ